MSKNRWEILTTFIPEVEGFTSRPYWDYKQWTWGYGTAAGFDKNHKPTGTISKSQALIDATKHMKTDNDRLSGKITADLTESQWAALLSFSYNEGVGNAENLINDINSHSPGLEAHFKKYVYAGGKRNATLVNRRNKEWILWKS